MSPPQRGNPTLKVRLEPDLVEEANESFPAVKGRSGGVALALRRLLYLALDKPMPRQFGEIGRTKDIDELEELIRKLETPPPDADLCQWVSHRAKDLLKSAELDQVDRLRLTAVLGRLTLLKQEGPK